MERDKYGKIILPESVMRQLEAMGPVREVPRTEAQKNCTICQGYGLWAGDDPTPMGPMDAGDEMPTQECPECHANPNPLG